MCSRPRAEPQELHMHANTKTAAKASARSRPGSVLTLWRPEDRQFWEREGEAIARINLWISVPALFLADRKSTRLNSSHLVISYAVFCLKKKNHHNTTHRSAIT